MNENHEGLAVWSPSHLEISGNDSILDIGCGGGVNVERFLKATQNKVIGLDYSQTSVERSRELNHAAIEEGRCEIIHCSVSIMPFEDNTFDIAIAFETVYFWPDFVNDLKEVHRVLKDAGIIFIANEALPIEGDERQKHIIKLLDKSIYSRDELESFLHEAGFRDLTSHVRESEDSFTGDDAEWICTIAYK